MADVLCKEVFVVEYLETGWGHDKWTREFDTEQEAKLAVFECNAEKDPKSAEVITAQYLGRKLREV